MGAIWRSRIPAIRAGRAPKASAIVEQTTHEIQHGAMGRSRVDTGAMREGWDAEVSGTRGKVENSVHYAHFNEYGTRKMSAQPMLAPAVEEARGPFVEAMAQIVES